VAKARAITCARQSWRQKPIWVDYGRLALAAGRASEAKLAFQQATLRVQRDNELRYWAKLRAPNLQLSTIAHDNLSVDCGSFAIRGLRQPVPERN